MNGDERKRLCASADLLVRAHPELRAERDALLGKRTTFGIGGPADLLIEAHRADDVIVTLRWARDHNVPVTLLGGGSNVLIADAGIRGFVLTLGGELAEIHVRDDGREIWVGAAATYPKLTRRALDEGWPSAVGWMGTPGQVGGALRMNAGTRDGEIGDVVVEVSGANPDGVVVLSREACGFGYRTSTFPSTLVLTSALLRCESRRREDAAELSRVAKERLARRHATQPKKRSAGSLFKNPPGQFAGRLIEEAGLKGTRVGGASISTVHANFFVNDGGATAADIVALANLAQAEVERRTGVRLEWEVKRIGEFS